MAAGASGIAAAVCGVVLLGGGPASAAGAGWPWFKADVHVHTSFSGDGDPDLGITAHSGKAFGYSVLFLTDHGRGGDFPIGGQRANRTTLDETLDRWTPLKVGNPNGVAELVQGPEPPAMQGQKSLRVTSSGIGGISSVTTRRGPGLRAGKATIKVGIRPISATGNGGLFVSASIGGDPTTGAPAGYTTDKGVVLPGKSYTFVWYWKAPPPAALYQGTNLRTFELGANQSFSQCAGPIQANTWTTCTIDLTGALNSPLVPASERPHDMNGFQDVQLGASGNGADGQFDVVEITGASPETPAAEFAYRTALLPLFQDENFRMYPGVEIGVGSHTQRFNGAAFDESQTSQDGLSALAVTQAGGYPAQLNHPGVPGGVQPDQAVIDNDAYGADLMEVMAPNMIADWDALWSKGVRVVGTWGTDNHNGPFSNQSEANHIQAPSIEFDALMRSLYEGRLFMALGGFQGRMALNLDPASQDAFPARYPVFVSPEQASAQAHVAISSGISPGSQVVWITNGGAQLGAADATDGPGFDRQRHVPLAGALTYVRAELRDGSGKRIAMTQPIMWIDVPGLPAGMSARVDGVETPGGTGYTRGRTKGATGATWSAADRTLTLALENPAGSLVEIAGTTGGMTPARVTIDGASVPRAGTLADYQASPRAWMSDASGSLRIKATQRGATGAIAISFAGGGDTIAPNPPAGVAAAPGPGGVTIGWKPAADNVAVAGYTVYRDGVAVAETTTNRFTDTGATAGGAHRYTVDAWDAARNQSLQSAPAVVGDPLPPEMRPPDGGGGGPSTPAAVIAGAFQSAASQPHTEAYDVRASLRLGQVPAAAGRSAPRPASARATGQAQVQNERRARTGARLSTVPRRLTIVAFDGTTYVSRDGRTFRRAVGSLRNLLPPLPPAGLGRRPSAMPGALTGLVELKPTRVAGIPVRHFRARLTTTGLRQYVAGALTQTGRAPARARAAAATAKARTNRVDLYVTTAGGRLQRAVVSVTAAVDAGKLVAGRRPRIPGTLTASTSVTASRYGGRVTVEKPRAKGTVASLNALRR